MATGKTIPLAALVCDDELNAQEVSEIKRGKNHTVFTAKGFIDNYWSIDPLKCLSGLCDM